jgi:hypothetical protein
LRNVEVAREILYAARLFNESHQFVRQALKRIEAEIALRTGIAYQPFRRFRPTLLYCCEWQSCSCFQIPSIRSSEWIIDPGARRVCGVVEPEEGTGKHPLPDSPR